MIPEGYNGERAALTPFRIRRCHSSLPLPRLPKYSSTASTRPSPGCAYGDTELLTRYSAWIRLNHCPQPCAFKLTEPDCRSYRRRSASVTSEGTCMTCRELWRTVRPDPFPTVSRTRRPSSRPRLRDWPKTLPGFCSMRWSNGSDETFCARSCGARLRRQGGRFSPPHRPRRRSSSPRAH